MPDAKQGEVCSSIVCFIFWSLFVPTGMSSVTSLTKAMFVKHIIPEANWHKLRDQLDEGHVGAACNTVPEANWLKLRDQLDEGHVGAACNTVPEANWHELRDQLDEGHVREAYNT